MQSHREKVSFLAVLVFLIALFAPMLLGTPTAQAAQANDLSAAAQVVGQTVQASAYPAWDSGKNYLGGDIVSYNGF